MADPILNKAAGAKKVVPYSSSKDRINGPSLSSPEKDLSSSSSRNSIGSPLTRPGYNIPTPAELRQGINSPNISPLQKRNMLAQKRAGGDQNTPTKLPSGTIMLMIATSVFFDLGELFLDLNAIGFVVNPFIDIIVEIGFYIWFKTRGLNMGTARNAITFLGGGMLEIFFDGAIPLWTVDIGLIIAFTRAEEFAKKNIPGAKEMLNNPIAKS